MAACSVIPVALLGLGTVGGGVYELFQRQKDEFFPKAGALPMITRILVRDLKKPRPGVDPVSYTHLDVYKRQGIVFYEKGGARLAELVGPADAEMGVFVGSESGFSPEEIALLQEYGVCPATLGKRILRCETAPICELSILLSLLGDI